MASIAWRKAASLLLIVASRSAGTAISACGVSWHQSGGISAVIISIGGVARQRKKRQRLSTSAAYGEMKA